MASVSAIAIDGGGSRCRIAALLADRVVTVETGPANVSTDFDGAIREIRRGLETLAAELGAPSESIATLPAYVGVAGVTGPVIAGQVEAALPFRRIRVTDDRPSALRGALGPRDGAVAHCGTGSFFGLQREGHMRFAGGWGARLGDEASAQWVGRKALALTLKTTDGRLTETSLTRALLERFIDPAGIVRFAGEAAPQDFGRIAPDVTRYAESGDPVARRILQIGADEIASGLTSIGWTVGDAVCLTGGIGPSFAPYLPETMRAALAEPDGEPLAGALSLARDLATETAGEPGATGA